MDENTLTLSQVVGDNVRRLRGTHTLEEVATYGRALGARWSSGSVSAIERGDFKTTVETLVLLALALDRLEPEGKTLEGTITVHDLLQSDGQITLSPKCATTSDHLLAFLGGGTSGSALDLDHMLSNFRTKFREHIQESKGMNLPDDSIDLVERIEQAGPESAADQRLAKKIGIRPYELRAWSVHLWKKSFEDHRDEIAGPDATPQKKGRASRDLLEEIQAAMKENRGDR